MKRLVEKSKSRWRKFSKVTRLVIIVLLAFLVCFRLALPFLVETYVNRKLDQLPEYDGRIGDVDIHIIRGAYSLHHIDIVKTTGKVPIPFFAARKVDFSIQWRELFHGGIVGEIFIDRGKLNFVKGRSEEESQTGIDKSWVGIVEDLFPFQINKFEFNEGEVWFRDFHSNPKVDLYVTNLHLLATNLTNNREINSNLPAACDLSGVTLGEGRIHARIGLNLLEKRPTFDLNGSLTNINLVALNDFLRAYARFDVSRGRMDIFSEIAAAEGKFDGYVKPLLHDLDVLDLKEDKKNPVQLVWETVVAVLVKVFRNQPKDQFGTKIPITGTFDKPEVGVIPTVLTLLHNAFLRALSPKIDDSIRPEKVEKKAAKEEQSNEVNESLPTSAPKAPKQGKQ